MEKLDSSKENEKTSDLGDYKNLPKVDNKPNIRHDPGGLPPGGNSEITSFFLRNV